MSEDQHRVLMECVVKIRELEAIVKSLSERILELEGIVKATR